MFSDGLTVCATRVTFTSSCATVIIGTFIGFWKVTLSQQGFDY